MPQTPILALPFPAASDPADVPVDLQELAQQIEAKRNVANGLAGTDANGKVATTQLPEMVRALVTTLPASPVDGQVAILVDNAASPTYLWQLRWNAAAARWEFVGGGPARAAVPTSETTTTVGSYVNLTTAGPTLTVPRAGDYLVRFGATVLDSAADSQINIGVGAGDFSAPSAEARGHISTANYHLSIVGETLLSGLAAGAVLRLKYQQAIAGTLTVLNRYLHVTPARVT